MELSEKAAVHAGQRRARLLQDLRSTAVQGMRAAGTRTEHVRWTTVIGLAEELEDADAEELRAR